MAGEGDDQRGGGREEREVVYQFGPASENDEPVLIDDPATLKALYDPIRFRIIGLLERPRPVREIAAAMGSEPNRLYYHVKLLEQRGLIRVVEQRVVGNNVERVYGRASNRVRLSADIAGSPIGQAAIEQRRSGAVVSFQRVISSEGAPDTEAVRQLLDISGDLTRDEAKQLAEAIHTVVRKTFHKQRTKKQRSTTSEDTQRYGLVVGFGPIPTEPDERKRT